VVQDFDKYLVKISLQHKKENCIPNVFDFPILTSLVGDSVIVEAETIIIIIIIYHIMAYVKYSLTYAGNRP
jgi:hypothetical protein